MTIAPIVETYHLCRLLHAEQEDMLRKNKYTKRDRRLLQRCQRKLVLTTRAIEDLDIADLYDRFEAPV